MPENKSFEKCTVTVLGAPEEIEDLIEQTRKPVTTSRTPEGNTLVTPLEVMSNRELLQDLLKAGFTPIIENPASGGYEIINSRN